MGRFLTMVLGLMILGLLTAFLTGAEDHFYQDENVTVLTVSAASEPGTEPQGTETLELPLQIPGTTLLAERLVCYEGPFIEDGSDEPVSNITALVLRNTGETEITEAEVLLEGEGVSLRFHAFDILPGMSVMVLEQGSALYFQGEIIACTGWANTAEYTAALLDSLQITAIDMGTLEIVNLGNEALEDLWLYHKNYLPDGTYVGGITYKTIIESLEPGQSILIYPEHYADGYSKIFKADIK